MTLIYSIHHGKLTLKNHTEFTAMGVKDTNYMILSEQLMLKQMLHKENIPHKPLSKNLFNCKDVEMQTPFQPISCHITKMLSKMI